MMSTSLLLLTQDLTYKNSLEKGRIGDGHVGHVGIVSCCVAIKVRGITVFGNKDDGGTPTLTPLQYTP